MLLPPAILSSKEEEERNEIICTASGLGCYRLTESFQRLECVTAL